MNLHLLNIKQRRTSLLRIVQLLTAIPVNIFLLVTINNYGNLFGARDHISFTGIIAIICFIILAVIAVSFLYSRKKSGFFIGAFAFFGMSCCFAYCFANDWTINFIGILFNLITGFLLLKDSKNFNKNVAGLSDNDKFQPGVWGRILLWLNGVVICLAILEAGYRIVNSHIGIISIIILFLSVLFVSCKQEWRINRPSFRHGPYIEWLLIPLIIFTYLLTNNLFTVIALIAFRQVIVTIRYFSKTKFAGKLSKYLFRRPAQLLGLSFFIVISIGAIILSFPYASAGDSSIKAIDAIFTAVSATCVTGLIVLDTPHDFTVFGQSIILILIQVGGLGIMTISTFAAIIIGRNVGLGQEYSLTKMTGEASVNRVYRLIKFICLFTFIIEIIGAATLFLQFSSLNIPLKTNLWKSVFHSISAFCNAGFSLQTDSLIPFQYNPGILFTFSALIIIGGLGFGVLYWFFEIMTFKHRKISFHVKVVFYSTIILLVGMTCFVLLFENNGALKNFSVIDKISNAWFYSVTPRTAGFNTITVDSVSPLTRFVTIVLMFIGVAPGSTGGGVKITTIFILLLTVRTLMRGDKETQGFNYSISNSTIYRAAAVFFLGITTCVLGFAFLIATQSFSPESIAFETVSAFGTVGLSMGDTVNLNTFGKLVIIVLMFIGRVGPLTLVLSMQPMKRQEIFYPKADIMVG